MVAWGDADGLRVAVRTVTGGPLVVRRILATPTSEVDSVQVAADPHVGWVIAAVEAEEGLEHERARCARSVA